MWHVMECASRLLNKTGCMSNDAKKNRDRRRGRPTGDDHPDLKGAFLQGAIELFGERGFEGVSLSQIAAKADADVGLTRYYFGSKAALWEAAMEHLASCFVAELTEELIVDESSKTNALKALIRAFVFASARWPQVSRIIVVDGDKLDERGTLISDKFVGPFYELMSELVEGAQAEGTIPDVSVRTIFFMVTHGGSFPMALRRLTNKFPGGDIASREALNAHADAIIALIMD